VQPPTKFADFKASAVRAPSHRLIRAPHIPEEITGPSGDDIWEKLVGPAVTISPVSTMARRWASASSCRAGCWTRTIGRVPNTMIEILQANAGGRYVHEYDQHDSPRDPISRAAGAITDAEGRSLIKPGAYPWYNAAQMAWRRAHPLFLWARALLNVSYTDVFPRRSLVRARRHRHAVPEAARQRLVRIFRSRNDRAFWALSYRSLVLRGARATRWRHRHGRCRPRGRRRAVTCISACRGTAPPT